MFVFTSVSRNEQRGSWRIEYYREDFAIMAKDTVNTAHFLVDNKGA